MIKPAIVKRIERSGLDRRGLPSKGDTCPIDGKDWMSCKHNTGDIAVLMDMYRQEKLAKEVCE